MAMIPGKENPGGDEKEPVGKKILNTKLYSHREKEKNHCLLSDGMMM